MDEPPTPPEPELYRVNGAPVLGPWEDLPPMARDAWLALSTEPEPDA